METDPLFETDLAEALIAWQEGETSLPPGRAAALLDRVQKDAAFRQALARQIWTLSLSRIAEAPEPRWLTLNEALGITGQPVNEAEEDLVLDKALMNEVQRKPLRLVPAGWRWAAFGALAAAVALVAGMLWFQFEASSATQEGRKSPPLAVVIQADAAVGSGVLASTAQAGTPLLAGPLVLESGRISLMFTSGVVLHLEGPAHLDLLTTDRVLCRDGRLRLRVPKGAEGFCIETPGGAVTDLGTELGVTVGKDGNTRVAVFEGEAEASLRIPGQEGVRTELLGAKQSVKLIPATGQIEESTHNDSGPAGFLPAPELRIPPLRLTPGYAEMIKTARPALYWRLDRLENGVIPNEVSEGPALKLAGEASLEPDEIHEGQTTMHLGGKKAPGALYGSEAWKAPGQEHAIEMWFASTTNEQMALAAFTTGKAPHDHLELVELAVRQPGRSPRPGVVRYLTRWPAGSAGGINIYTAPEFLPYQWHHLVAQQSGGRMELFLNGRSVGTADADAFAPEIMCSLQFGCLRFNAASTPESMQRAFSGKLAEIAVYDRLLTREEIRKRCEGRR